MEGRNYGMNMLMNENFAPMFNPQGIRLVSYCPLCHMHYSIREARVIEENEDTHLMHMVCRKCSSSILILTLTGELGVSSVGLITDLTGDDVLRFKSATDVSDDDVLATHTMLHDGDADSI